MENHTNKILQWEYIKKALAKYSLSKNKLQLHKIQLIKSKTEIEESLNETLEMKNFLENIKNTKEELKLLFYDIRPYLKQCKVENSYLLHKELIKIAKTIAAGRKIYLYIAPQKTIYPLLFKLANSIPILKDIENTITTSFDKLGKLKNNASPNLAYIRKQIRHSKYNIEQKLYKLLDKKENKEIIQEHIITTRENRYVIPIKRDFKGRAKGITIDKSGSNETLFIEPNIITVDNNHLINIQREEKLEEINILKELTTKIRNNIENINKLLDRLSYFDLVYTKGKLAIDMNAIMPQINNNGVFKIYSARHPILKNKAVPIDIILGEKYNILIITGPNTTGKTLALKTLGLLSTMALSGMLIPAKENSTISMLDQIFIDSGDEQSIEKKLSTFSAHIKQIIHILKYATEKSLVLIDEIGAGTDPEEGSSIAIAILDQLKEIQCKTIITSHYKAIRNYPLSEDKKNKHSINASCSINKQTLTPIYKLTYGKAEKSNAFDIARKIGLDKKIIQKAESIIQKQKSIKDKLIEQIEEKENTINQKIEEYQNKINKAKEKEIALNKKEKELIIKENLWKESLLKKELEKIQTIRKNALKLYKDIHQKADNIQKNYIKNNINTIDKAFTETKDYHNKVSYTLENNKQTKQEIENIRKGDAVYIISLNKEGIVYEIQDKEVIVQIDAIRINVKKADIRRSESKTKEDNCSHYIKQNEQTQLNVIGLNQEEAIHKANKYIENLNSNGTKYGKIIHGYGKGILQKAIANLFENNKLIKSFHHAEPNEGGYGVTIINMK